MGVLSLILFGGCGSGGGGPRSGIVLSGAFFAGSKPVPTRLLLARPGSEKWTVEVLEAGDGSLVFHKAMEFQPRGGSRGLLTVSGAKKPVPAYVKFWTENGDVWTAETLHEGLYGGDFDRCRDVEKADLNGDGLEDLVVVTHQRGVVFILEQKSGGKFETHEIDRSEDDIWIHEVETGDVDGDGQLEIFATPSVPNTLKGADQPGKIVMYKKNGDRWEKSLIVDLAPRHAKEILVCNYFHDGKAVLFAAVEGGQIGGGGGGETSEVRLYRWTGEGFSSETIIDLPGKLCRVLCLADTDGDGSDEIIASTAKDGIHCVYRDGDTWRKRTVVSSSVSSGFEHAALAMDGDGDGKDEVYAVSDDDKKLRRFTWDPAIARYKAETLLELDYSSLFIFSLEPLPAGM